MSDLSREEKQARAADWLNCLNKTEPYGGSWSEDYELVVTRRGETVAYFEPEELGFFTVDLNNIEDAPHPAEVLQRLRYILNRLSEALPHQWAQKAAEFQKGGVLNREEGIEYMAKMDDPSAVDREARSNDTDRIVKAIDGLSSEVKDLRRTMERKR